MDYKCVVLLVLFYVATPRATAINQMTKGKTAMETMLCVWIDSMELGKLADKCGVLT